MSEAEKIVENLLGATGTSQSVIIQYVSPGNSFWWFTGEPGNRWSKDREQAKLMLEPDAEGIVNNYESNPAYKGRVGIMPAEGNVPDSDESGR